MSSFHEEMAQTTVAIVASWQPTHMPNYFQSVWCQHETAAAAASGVPIIPMPFGSQDLEDLYNEFMLPVLNECQLDCARGDDIFSSNVVMDDVKAAIARADLVIADLSGQNPNVFCEAGIAHTLEKPVLLLSQSIDDVPFDLRHRRVLSYEYSPVVCKRFVAKLREHVLAMLGME